MGNKLFQRVHHCWGITEIMPKTIGLFWLSQQYICVSSPLKCALCVKISPYNNNSHIFVFQESISQVRPLVICRPNVERQQTPGELPRGSKCLMSLWPASLSLPLTLLLLLPLSLSLVIVIVSFLLPWARAWPRLSVSREWLHYRKTYRQLRKGSEWHNMGTHTWCFRNEIDFWV